MPKNWLEWHELYQTEARLQQRIQIVREFIASALNAQPPGIIRVVSACAGDGRDLLGTLVNHPRQKDVYARLVEIDPQLVERGRATLEEVVAAQIEFVNGDATLSSNYAGAVPADIVLVCGIFGNLAHEAELNRLLRNLQFLAKTGAFIVWTRGHRDGIAYSEIVRKNLRETNFEEVDFRLTLTGDMGVGLHRYLGQTAPLPTNEQLFVFSGSPERAVSPTPSVPLS